jgi:hypothetical protein
MIWRAFQFAGNMPHMDHRGVPYTIRTGIERNHWVVVVRLPDGKTVEKRVQRPRREAQARACSIIDEWLGRKGPQAR